LRVEDFTPKHLALTHLGLSEWVLTTRL